MQEKSSRIFDNNAYFVYEEIVPPQKLKKNLYRCDNRFELNILHEMSKKYENYRILLLSGDESKLYNVTGSSHKLLCTITCHAPGKQGHGGQSQQRLDRIRIETINEYHKRVLEKVKLYYIDNATSLPNIKGLILGKLVALSI